MWPKATIRQTQLRLLRHLILLIVLSPSTSLQAQQTPPPELTAIEPNSGVTTPGIEVTVAGTSFSQDAIVYFDGLQARQLRFISSSTLQVTTPYLRPGIHKVQFKSGENTIRSELTFLASPAPIDLQIDRAMSMSNHGEVAAALTILRNIAKENPDLQVRAFAHFQSGQIYFAHGD